MFLSIVTFLLTLASIGYSFYANRVRGDGDKPWYLPNKLAVYASMTLFYLVSMFAVDFTGMLADGTALGFIVPNTQEWMLQSHLFITLAVCFSFGWGKYFVHGKNKIGESIIWKETEFGPADWLANTLVGKWDRDRDEKFVKNWQTIGMCGRFGFTFGIVLFPLLAAVSESYLVLLGTPTSFLAGFAYRLAFNDWTNKSVKNAEHIVGAVLGLLLALPMISRLLKKNSDKEK